ncbi:hypothetical protein GS471_06315 [Rhodococcus hoagii]|nr:hypothetical protein [Prescottella equi]
MGEHREEVGDHVGRLTGDESGAVPGVGEELRRFGERRAGFVGRDEDGDRRGQAELEGVVDLLGGAVHVVPDGAVIDGALECPGFDVELDDQGARIASVPTAEMSTDAATIGWPAVTELRTAAGTAASRRWWSSPATSGCGSLLRDGRVGIDRDTGIDTPPR